MSQSPVDAYEGGAPASSGSNPFAAASAGALQDLNTPAAPVSDPAPPAPVATPDPPVAATPPAAAPVVPDSEPSDLTFELKVKGQSHKLNRDEMVELAQKGLDYTQKTQKLSEDQRQMMAAASILQQREAEIAAFLRDPVKVQQYVSAMQQQAAAAATHPDEIPTQSQILAQLQQREQTLKAEIDTKVQEAEQRISQHLFNAEVAEKQTVYEAEIVKTVTSLIEKFPALATYEPEDLDIALRADVAKQVKAQMEAFPEKEISIKAVQDLMVAAAQKRAARSEAKINDHVKMAAVRASKLTKQGIEPAGGTPAATPAPPTKSPKLGSKELLDSVMAEISALPTRE